MSSKSLYSPLSKLKSQLDSIRRAEMDDEMTSQDGSYAGEDDTFGGKENTGRWTEEEHKLFVKGLKLHNKQWKLIAEMIKSRTVVQIRTHAQKYFQKLLKSRLKVGDNSLEVLGMTDISLASTGSKRKHSIVSDVTSDGDSETDSDVPAHKRPTGAAVSSASNYSKSAAAAAAASRKASGTSAAASNKKSILFTKPSVHSPSPKGIADVHFVDNRKFHSTPYFNTMAPSAAGDNSVAQEMNEWARVHHQYQQQQQHQQSRGGGFTADMSNNYLPPPPYHLPPAASSYENNYNMMMMYGGCGYQQSHQVVPPACSSDLFCGNDNASFDLFWNNPAGIVDMGMGMDFHSIAPSPPAHAPSPAATANTSVNTATARRDSSRGSFNSSSSSSFSKSSDSYTSCEDSSSDDNCVDEKNNMGGSGGGFYYPTYQQGERSDYPTYQQGEKSDYANYQQGGKSDTTPTSFNDNFNFQFDDDIFVSGILDALA